MNQTEEWILIDEFGKSRTMIQKSAVKLDGPVARLPVRYSLNPPGTDKRNGKPVDEMIILEEYNLERRESRVYQITLFYVDGGSSNLPMKPDWRPVSEGSEKTLDFLVTLTKQPIHAEFVSGISLPREIGSFELRSVIDNEKSNPGLGVTLLYHAPGVKASVYVYDHSQIFIPVGINSSTIRKEFAESNENIKIVHPYARILVREEPLSVSGIHILHSVFQYDEERSESLENVVSHLYMTALRGNFIKVRLTYSATDRPEFGRAIQNQFIEALCKVLSQ